MILCFVIFSCLWAGVSTGNTTDRQLELLLFLLSPVCGVRAYTCRGLSQSQEGEVELPGLLTQGLRMQHRPQKGTGEVQGWEHSALVLIK